MSWDRMRVVVASSGTCRFASTLLHNWLAKVSIVAVKG